MNTVDKALQTQINNIEQKTGKSLAELTKIVNESNLTKFGQLRDMIKEQFSLGHGDANTLVHLAKKAVEGSADQSLDATVAEIYSSNKADLRPIHEAVMARIVTLGDFEIAPKKTYLSLRRKKQFAMVGPGSKGRVEVGLNMKGVAGTSRLEALPPGKMCQYRVFISTANEVDDELLGWIQTAFDNAG